MSFDTTAPTAPTVDALMAQTFSPGRTPRSDAYQAGTRAQFARYLERASILCPFRAGSAEFDAFWAGSDEAHAVIRLQQIPVSRQEASHV